MNNVKTEEILDTLNFVNRAINFTMEFFNEEVPCLDFLIKRDSSGI